MNIRKFFRILKEYPIAAAACTVIDIIVTYRYTQAAENDASIAIAYFIALFGTLTAVLFFTLGWICARNKVEDRENELRRMNIKNEIASMYSREFYNITKNIS